MCTSCGTTRNAREAAVMARNGGAGRVSAEREGRSRRPPPDAAFGQHAGGEGGAGCQADHESRGAPAEDETTETRAPKTTRAVSEIHAAVAWSSVVARPPSPRYSRVQGLRRSDVDDDGDVPAFHGRDGRAVAVARVPDRGRGGLCGFVHGRVHGGAVVASCRPVSAAAVAGCGFRMPRGDSVRRVRVHGPRPLGWWCATGRRVGATAAMGAGDLHSGDRSQWVIDGALLGEIASGLPRRTPWHALRCVFFERRRLAVGRRTP